MEQIEICPFNSTAPVHELYPEIIERIASENLPYEHFFKRFLQPNCAVIITSIANDWECFNRWINRTTIPPRLNVEYLKKTLPNVSVPVADCEKRYYNSHEKLELRFHDFLDTWACFDDNENQEPIAGRSRYYLKDWHLRSAVPDYCFYQTPSFFASDWLNEYLLEKGSDDYRFVYMGPKGTWTGFHADVFGSYSWSVNIFGQKLWYLLPPGEEGKLLDTLKNLPFMVTEKSLHDADVKFYTILQQPGEALFVPSGWYHQVLNVDDSISVNHNWFNGCNVETIWKNLRDALQDVLREIDDCRSMENFDEHSQIMLKATFGMDYRDFVSIVLFICDKRLASVKDGAKMRNFTNFELGERHTSYDLMVIQNLLSEVVDGNHLASAPDLLSMAVNGLNKIKSCVVSLC